MSIERIKQEVWYCIGRRPTVQEAEEIMDFAELNTSADLSEIISDYYGC